MNNITRFLNHRREKPVQEDLGHSQDWMGALPCLEFMKKVVRSLREQFTN